jgi:exodeoxyribonuclease VII small subunit
MARKNQTAPDSFEQAQRELEQIVTQIEGGDVSLEESLAKYERGVFLIQYCRTVLSSAEKRIELLTKGEDGTLQSQPLPDPTPETP